MQRTARALVDFVADQATKTKRRPSRLFLIPYGLGLTVIHQFLNAMAERRVIRHLRVHRKVDSDVRRVFALVTGQLVHEPYPPGYKISKVWRRNLSTALSKTGTRPSAALLAYLSLSIFDLQLEKLDVAERENCAQRRKDFNRKHNELSSLRESPVCPETTTVVVDDGSHSAKMDQALHYYDEIYSAIPKTERLGTIAEIGSGYGRFAGIMHQLDLERCYILIDLPEALMFAYAFLSVSFPTAKRLFIASAADVEAGYLKSFNFVFCPIQLIIHLSNEQVDLVINTYSLAEMPQSSVDYLMDCIHRVIRPRYLYSRNMMFSDKTINYDTGGLDGEANEVTLNLRPGWRIRSFSLEPAIIEGKYRLTAGAVLERVPSETKQDVISAAVAASNSLDLGDPTRIANLYFAALWSLDTKLVLQFRSELQQYCRTCGFSADVGYDFERIGEVRYLRRSESERNHRLDGH